MGHVKLVHRTMKRTAQGAQKDRQQGRSEVRGARNNERRACGRQRDGEPAVS